MRASRSSAAEAVTARHTKARTRRCRRNTPLSYLACATAQPFTMCPSVSPRQGLSRESRGALALVPFERKLDQLVEQRRKGYPTVFPHLRIHADRREARDGVDLVDVELVRRSFEEKIHAPHAFAINRAEALHSQPPQLVGLLRCKIRRDFRARFVEQVFIFVIVEFPRRQNLAR